MKKVLMIAAASAFLVSGLAVTEATAGGYVKKCSSCHQATADKAGPSWATVKAAYGSADALAAVFESGFAVADRKVAAADEKWAKKAGMMTSQYDKLIVKKGFKKGKTTAADLAAEIFAQ